jgi:hypothetical protein
MRCRFLRLSLWYALPLALFAPDALAWGLQSHLVFAHYALLMMPFADARLRAAAARFPRLVLTGACLPDLALTGRFAGTPAFRRTHRWSTLRRISAVPRDDADCALLVGYASHLVTDVVAHNDFVPEHEARIARVRHAVHALAEWAMDDHLRAELPARPGELLAENHGAAADFAARAFRCDVAVASRALRLLQRADQALRGSTIPAFCGVLLHLSDRNLAPRFDGYLRRATAALQGIEAAMAGALVDWKDSDPEGYACEEGAHAGTGQDIARIVQSEHHP